MYISILKSLKIPIAKQPQSLFNLVFPARVATESLSLSLSAVTSLHFICLEKNGKIKHFQENKGSFELRKMREEGMF